MSDRKIGVYICHCGGNISDYVDVEKVRKAVEGEAGVVVAKTAMFTCSDATQQEMVDDIRENNLDGLVVASCSPKLHLYTFREVAKRAGINPYQYTQVNIREQCSWTHTDDHGGATDKAARLIRAGIAKTRLLQPLNPVKIDTVQRVLVVGAGITGLRAALGLADIGISVYLVEKEKSVGGRVAGLGSMFPHGKSGKELINQLAQQVRQKENIAVFTGAELVEKSGSMGNFSVRIRVGGHEDIIVNVGSIITATGFDSYPPAGGEYGYGAEGVVTLPEYRELLDSSGGPPVYNGREIRDVVYVYCVGSRQGHGLEKPNLYCSRYCCSAAVHSALLAREKNPRIRQYHLFRDMRTYGKYDLLYNKAASEGTVFLKFDGDAPPSVENTGGGRMKVTVRDLLTYGEEIEIGADLVVLVTGMIPKKDSQINDVLKLPLGKDGFFNEIHPKLRPVETVVDGVFICGACQGPKNSSESVASALAAVTQSASLLKKGFVELDPLMAEVDRDTCRWCGACEGACPYGAIGKDSGRGEEVAVVNEALCKGCGGCVPVCPQASLNLRGYTDAQVKSMIDALLKENVS
ncbi:MAG: CoB--CoM heterodisulfide reductase iron-sulfur subunit A family protein [Bacillota bacterium]